LNKTANMKTLPLVESRKPGFVIRVHLTDGSVASFAQNDEVEAQKLWDKIHPSRLFAPSRLVLAGEHSKSLYVTAKIVRVDFIQKSSDCWEFPGGSPAQREWHSCPSQTPLPAPPNTSAVAESHSFAHSVPTPLSCFRLAPQVLVRWCEEAKAKMRRRY